MILLDMAGTAVVEIPIQPVAQPEKEKKDDLKVPNVEDILAELYAQMDQKMNFPNVDEAELKEKCKLAKITLSESKEKLAKISNPILRNA